MKYINADDLLSVLKDIHPLDYNGMALKAQIMTLPSVDVVEGIRCKNCKYYEYKKILNGIKVRICTLPVGLPYACDNDYCSRGEKK